ncbi:MAG: lysophospholipid acyltransferase family protein [Thiogranum sp.]|nr:lysophospholipid acyltransferase family protein [Thiogranum sp.]
MARLIFKTTANRFVWLETAGWWLEARMLALFWWWVKGTSAERASQRGYCLLRWLGPRLRKNQHIMGNLQIAFPDMVPSERLALGREVWGNLGAVIAEYPFLRELNRGGPKSRIEISLSEASRPVVKNRQPAVYVTAHLANWEIAALAISGLNIPLTTIYSQQSNPLIDRQLQSFREIADVKFVPKKNAVRELPREIRKGRSVGILPDQRSDGGKLVPYFGVDAPTVISPAWLAMRMSCPLVPVEVERTGQARFRATFHDPIEVPAGIEDARKRVLETTRRINACFESWIRKNPEHWHCTKRRWPAEVYQDVGP